MNRGNINHALAVFGPEFKILAQSAISAKPSKRSLNHPAPRNDFKALLVIAAQGDIHHDFLEFLTDKIHKFASIAAIGPDALQAFEQRLGQLLEQLLSGFAVGDVGRPDQDLQQVAQRIYQDVPFTALDQLAAIKAALLAADCCRLHTLAVNGRGTGLPLAPHCLSHLLTQGRIDLLPHPLLAPALKVVKDTVVIGVFFRQQFPLTAGLIDIKYGIHHTAHVQFAWSSPIIDRYQRLNQRPLCLGHITGIYRLFVRHFISLLFGSFELFALFSVPNRSSSFTDYQMASQRKLLLSPKAFIAPIQIQFWVTAFQENSLTLAL